MERFGGKLLNKTIMLKNLLLLLTIFICTSLSAQSWDGGGDGTSWDDAANWSGDAVPAEGATITFPDEVTASVTGTAPNSIRRIIFDTLSNVTLDLDIDFALTGNPVHNVILNKDATATFGGATEMRTFNIDSGIERNTFQLNGEGTSLIISEQATVNVTSSQSGIRMSKSDATITNNGTLSFAGYFTHGINLISGTFDNNGTISIGAGVPIDGEEAMSDGINIDDGVFNNNAGGTITVTEPLDNGLEVLGTFNNAGTLSTISREDALGVNSGILVGSTNTEGFLNNLAGGVISADGGAGEANRAIAVQNSGMVNNEGRINVSGGNLGQGFFNIGTVTNNACAQIDLAECRILNNNTGMLTNNGLISSTYTAAGVNHGAAEGFALNNAFYAYANTNSDFAGGSEEHTDNGQKVDMGVEVDAEGNCEVNIGIGVSYTWYADAANTVEIATNDANGLLSFADDIFEESGTQTLYTCYGEEVALNVLNVAGDCTLTNGVDFVQLTDVFTLMPNPAQSFTQVKFSDAYIADEKNIEVYNAVGQLVQTANLNGADSYILQTSNLAAGIYTVNLQTENGMQIERLIIQK